MFFLGRQRAAVDHIEVSGVFSGGLFTGVGPLTEANISPFLPFGA